MSYSFDIEWLLDTVHTVQVTGDFDDWSRLLPESTGSKFKQKVVLSSPKDIRFKFIIDGVWTVDSSYRVDTDGEGNENNVIPEVDLNTVPVKVEQSYDKVEPVEHTVVPVESHDKEPIERVAETAENAEPAEHVVAVHESVEPRESIAQVEVPKSISVEKAAPVIPVPEPIVEKPVPVEFKKAELPEPIEAQPVIKVEPVEIEDEPIEPVEDEPIEPVEDEPIEPVEDEPIEPVEVEDEPVDEDEPVEVEDEPVDEDEPAEVEDKPEDSVHHEKPVQHAKSVSHISLGEEVQVSESEGVEYDQTEPEVANKDVLTPSIISTTDDDVISDFDESFISEQADFSKPLDPLVPTDTTTSSFAAVSIPSTTEEYHDVENPQLKDEDYEDTQLDEDFDTPTNSLLNSSVIQQPEDPTGTANIPGHFAIIKPSLLPVEDNNRSEVKRENLISRFRGLFKY